jgi:integrase
MLKRLCQAAEVKEFGFHSLRHFVASRLIDSQKANIVEIQQLLGHQRTTTTDTYLKSLSSTVGHLAMIIEEVVLPKPKSPEKEFEL